MLSILDVYQYVATGMSIVVWGIVLAGLYVSARLVLAARDTEFATDDYEEETK